MLPRKGGRVGAAVGALVGPAVGAAIDGLVGATVVLVGATVGLGRRVAVGVGVLHASTARTRPARAIAARRCFDMVGPFNTE